MGVVFRIRARLRGLFRRDAVAGEIKEELEFHVRMRTLEFERQGETPAIAAARARAHFGNLAVWQDHGYDVRGGGIMETIWQDIRYGVRLLIRQPGFSLVAIITLALGIGMTTAIVSVIDAAMLHPLPYDRPEELVSLNVEIPRKDRPGRPGLYGMSQTDLDAIRAATNAPVKVAMWRNIFGAPITDGAEPERLRGMEIDEHYLDIFGIAPIRGRAIQAQDRIAGSPSVVMIGYNYWQRRFAGKDDVIGQRLRLDNDSAEIIGVLPMTFNRTTVLFRPLQLAANMAQMRGSGASTYGRLRTGISLDQAQRELTEILSHVQSLGPAPAPGWLVRAETLLERSTYGYWTTAKILLGAVGLILLIACVNVAGLLLARGATRLHEVAIRASIGAGRLRIVRQLLTESLLLAIAGGTMGILVAWWTLDVLVKNIPLPVSSNVPATLNWRVLLFAFGLVLLTGTLFGIVPAIRLSRVRVNSALSRGTRRAGAALSRRGGQWLIGVEIALALVLVTGAGLMLRSFERLISVDLGFDPDSYMTVQAVPAELKPDVYSTYYKGLVDAIRQMPDVETVGAINHLPLMGSTMFTSATSDTGKDSSISFRQILPGYFEAIGLKPVTGRFPQPEDFTSGRSVVVIGQRTAKDLFGGDSPLGHVLTVQKGPAEIIGVAPDLKVDGADTSRPYNDVFALYRPKPDSRPDPLVIVVRPRSNAGGLPERLRQLALTTGPRAVVEKIRPGADWLGDNVVTERRQTVLLSLLGALGLLLTLIGVFGMTAYAVARRTQEIGVRMAFGAKPGDVVRTMVKDAALPVGAGVIGGLIGAWFATQLISTFLFQTEPKDLPTFAGAAITLAAAALFAAWIPARRAARVDPVTSLRAE